MFENDTKIKKVRKECKRRGLLVTLFDLLDHTHWNPRYTHGLHVPMSPFSYYASWSFLSFATKGTLTNRYISLYIYMSISISLYEYVSLLDHDFLRAVHAQYLLNEFSWKVFWRGLSLEQGHLFFFFFNWSVVVLHMYIFFFRFFSIIGCYEILNIALEQGHL